MLRPWRAMELVLTWLVERVIKSVRVLGPGFLAKIVLGLSLENILVFAYA